MRTIVLAATKGGVGKSSISVHLSTMTDGKTALIETDQQPSCQSWRELREGSDPVFYSYEDFKNFGLPALLAKAETAGCEYAVIDTPPHSQSSTAATFKHADVLVVPTEASLFPMKTMKSTLELVRASGKPVVLVLNKAMARERETAETLQALEATKLPVVVVHQRVAFKRALSYGITALEYREDAEAIKEMNKLWEVVKGVL